VHRDPAGDAYRAISTITAPSRIRLAASEIEVDLAALFS
jgi:hypothetical protein